MGCQMGIQRAQGLFWESYGTDQSIDKSGDQFSYPFACIEGLDALKSPIKVIKPSPRLYLHNWCLTVKNTIKILIDYYSNPFALQ